MQTRLAASFLPMLLLVLLAAPARAVPLDPSDFDSLGVLSGERLVLDTDALTINGALGGARVAQGGGAPDIAVFTFGAGSLLGDVEVVGRNALALLFLGDATVGGAVSLDARAGPGVSPGIGGAGGGDGGRGFSGLGNPPPTAGEGPGGGSPGSVNNGSFSRTGGTGGGHGTEGAGHGGERGARYGDLTDRLRGGSGGGGGGGFQGAFFAGGSGGGGGGGAVEIGALGRLAFEGARVTADGGDGAFLTGRTGGGGGSGGGILLHAFDIVIDAASFLSASGGSGFGSGGAAGGCGGGGRIAVVTNDDGALVNDGVLRADPGADGVGGALCDPGDAAIALLTAPDVGRAPSAVPAPPAAALLVLLALIGRRRPS